VKGLAAKVEGPGIEEAGTNLNSNTKTRRCLCMETAEVAYEKHKHQCSLPQTQSSCDTYLHAVVFHDPTKILHSTRKKARPGTKTIFPRTSTNRRLARGQSSSFTQRTVEQLRGGFSSELSWLRHFNGVSPNPYKHI